MGFSGRAMTRRFLGRILAGGVAYGVSRAHAAEGITPLTWGAELAAEPGHERRYRAQAQVLVLSVPLVRWSNVGGGSVRSAETESAAGRLHFLEFSGFSFPEHAAGLNRLGFIRELSRVGESGAAESLYFGLMTASPEETADEARKAMGSTAKEAAYTAIEGRLAGGAVETIVAHFPAPAQWSAANRSQLMERARSALAATEPRSQEGNTNGAGTRPFLHTLADALQRPSPVETRYAYAGRFYRLRLEKSPDAKATQYFRERRVIGAGADVVCASGKVRAEAGGKETSFRIWMEEGAPQPLPLRMEYQAKSYLKLLFEAEG